MPPIFEANISVIKKGTGSQSNSFAITNVIGIIRTTMVTLSKKAEAIAVKIAKASNTNLGCPFVDFKSCIASHLKIPLLLAICTIIIMPIRRKIMSNSMY